MEKNILLNETQVQEIVDKLAKEINDYYKDQDIDSLVVISLLKGGFMFCSDLIKKLEAKIFLDFLTASSYKDSEESSGNVEIISDISTDIKGKDVLIVDDIFDTGNTMLSIIEYLSTKKPNSIKTCVFLDKPSRRLVDLQVDFLGKEIDDLFVVGYGLDYQGYYRNIPYIFSFS